MMNPDDVIRSRRADWERLADLVKRARRGGIRTLSESELQELGDLYRAATADLALVQRDFPMHALAPYLNRLVGQAHGVVYQEEPVAAAQLRRFYLSGLPRLFREMGPFILTAGLLFFGPAVLTYLTMLANPDAGSYLLSSSQIAQIRSGEQWWLLLNGLSSMGASLIMTNNIQIAILAFAGGLLFGLLTLFILVLNGVQLGAVLGLSQVYGHAAPIWTFVIGHGVLELNEIVIAGGCGLALGYALLQPGLLTRREALTAAAAKSVRLLLGTLPVLVAAGLIEAFISPSDLPSAYKFAVGITSGLFLYSYLLLLGRQAPGSRGRDMRRYPAGAAAQRME